MTFFSDRNVKAVRKQRLCSGCGQFIRIGEPATRWAGMTDGDFGMAVYHPDCRAAEIALNQEILDIQYGDDWTGLSDIEDEDWPWLLEAHPAVAERMGIAARLANADTTERSSEPREAS